MRTPREAVAAYLRGDLVMGDMLTELGRCLVVEDVSAFIAVLPKDFLDELVQRLERFPSTEEGWSRMRVHRIAMWGREVPAAQVENVIREDVRLLRRSVELLRDAWARRQAGPQT
jgi:hypothetical protein